MRWTFPNLFAGFRQRPILAKVRWETHRRRSTSKLLALWKGLMISIVDFPYPDERKPQFATA